MQPEESSNGKLQNVRQRVVGMKKEEDVSEEKTSHQRNFQRYFVTLNVHRIKS